MSKKEIFNNHTKFITAKKILILTNFESSAILPAKDKTMIIVITGIDGSGKETQTNILTAYLQKTGVKVKKQSFPNYESKSAGALKMYLGGELSETANEINAYQAASLFVTDFFCTMKNKYEKFLQGGGVLLCDRYTESNLIHQAIKLPTAEEKIKFQNWLNNYQYNIMNIPKPDLVIFLNMPLKTCLKLANDRSSLKNGEKKDLHEQDISHLANAYTQCQKLAKTENWKEISCIDENGNLLPREKICSKIIPVVENFIKQNKTQKTQEFLK